MWLLVGLGNPGRQYEGTRHNVGFDVVDHLAATHGFGRLKKWAANAEVVKGVLGSEEVVLVKPLTFMNLSGEAVGAVAGFYKVPLERLVVVHDELDFEPGVVRLKVGGGHGGHNGLRSIAAHLGAEFVRVRLGIGKPPSAQQGADYVLSRFDGASKPLIQQAVEQAASALETIVRDGVQLAMGRFNRP